MTDMTTPELTRTPNRTEFQARSDIAASDRKSWFPGTRALGEYGIMAGRDGREVARFKARYDRDATVAMARAFDDMRSVLQEAREYLDGIVDVVDGSYGQPAPNRAMSICQEIDAALLKAEAVKP